jgi:hypothetical protein
MKRMTIAFGPVVVAVLMAIAASPALAEQPKWATCEEVSSGHWTNGRCTTAGGGSWETQGLAETVEVTSSSTGLELEDSKEGTAITCAGTGLGTAGANGAGSAIRVTVSKCKIVAGKAGSCEEPLTAEAVNLPWATKLTETGSEVREEMTSIVAGKAPGYAIECEVGGILKVTDECTGNITTKIGNNRSEGTVEAEFDAKSEGEKGNCTVGGASSGRVHGKFIKRIREWVERGVKHLIHLLAGWVLARIPIFH